MKRLLTFLSFLFLATYGIAQPCVGGIESASSQNAQGGAIVLSTAATSSQTITNINAGEYVRVWVCAGTEFTFSTCGSTSTMNSEISINDDAGMDAFGQYDDDGCGAPNGHASLTWMATVTGIVRVLITQNTTATLGGPCDMNPGVPVDLTITANAPCGPLGASCDVPIVVNTDSYVSGSMSTCDFGNAYDDTMISCAGENFYLNGNETVVEFTPTTSQSYQVNMSNPDGNSMGYFLLNGCPDVGGGCLINDGVGAGDPLIQNVNLVGGTTYYLIVSSNPANVTTGVECGNYEISIMPSPPGSVCESPLVIADGPFPVNMTGLNSCGFQDDYSTSNCTDDNYLDGEDLVLTFTPSATDCYRFTATNPGSVGMYVLDNCPNLGGSCIGEAGSNGDPLVIDGTLTAGTTYYIILDTDGVPDCTGDVDLTVDSCPPGTTCADPFMIAAAPFSQTGLTTCGLGDDYSTSACSDQFIEGEDWVATFTPSATGCYAVALSNTEDDTGLHILDGCPDAGGMCIGFQGTTGANPAVDVYLESGTLYYIIVSSDAPFTDCTAFDISVEECAQDGEDCSIPITLMTGTAQNISTCGFGDNYDSADACGSTFMNGDDVVLNYMPTMDGCYDIVTSGASNGAADFGVFILDGCPDAGATCLASGTMAGGEAMVTANLTAFTNYTIVIATSDCSDFTVVANSVGCPAGNVCANPQTVNIGANGPFDVNAAAGDDYSQNDACGSTYMGGNDFVMEFTVATADCYNFTTTAGPGANPASDLGLFILDGCPDDAGALCIAQDEVMDGFPVVDAYLNPGTYFVVVGAVEFTSPVLFGNSETTFNIDINGGGTMCPAGIDCGSPFIVMEGTPYNDLTSCGFGNDYGNGDGCANAYMIGEDFVMSFTPNTTDCYDFVTSAASTAGPADDVGLFVLDGCPDLPGTNCLVNQAAENGFPSGSAELMAGQTYFILVTGVMDNAGLITSSCANFNFMVTGGSVTCPTGPTCADPFVAPGLGTYNDLTTCGSGDDFGTADLCGSQYMLGEDAVITFTPPADGCYNFATSGTPNSNPDADVGLFVTTTCPDGGGDCLLTATEDNGFPSGDVELTGGVTYFITVSAVLFPAGGNGFIDPTCTAFNLSISNSSACPAAPNDCPFDAADITPLIDLALSQPHAWACDPSTQVFSDGVGHPSATIVNGDIGTIPCDISAGVNERNDIWYRFTYTGQNAWVDIYQNDGGSDLVTALYMADAGGISGTCAGVNGLTYVGCADDATGLDPVYDAGDCTTPVHNRLNISSLTPGEYYIRLFVDNGGEPVGAVNFQLCVEQGSTVPGAFDNCSELPHQTGGDPNEPSIGCISGEPNVDVDTMLTNLSNAGAYGNACEEPGNPNGTLSGSVPGNTGNNGCTGLYGPQIYANNVVNNNVFHSILINGDAACLGAGGIGPLVTITFSNTINNGGAFQVQVVPAGCPASGGGAVLAYSVTDPINNCFSLQSNIPNGLYYIVVDGQNGTLLGYDLHVQIDYDESLLGCNESCCYPPVATDPMDLAECDDGTNTATFDLTSLDNDIINGTPNATVNWYEDMDLNNPIGNPSSYAPTAGTPTFTTTVYATISAEGCESAPVAVDLTVNALPVIDNVTPTDATCGMMNGEIDVTISGGTAPYTVTVGSNSMNGNGPDFNFSGLAAGNYVIDVVDANGCTATAMTTINDTPSPTIDSAVPTDATCGNSDGQAVITISDGTPDYTVTIGSETVMGTSPVTVMNLPMGTYTVDVVDANGCTATGSVTIGETASPTIDMVTPTDATCGNADGSAEITISGGTPDYTVTINGEMSTGTSPVTVTGLPMGTYTVDVVDANGCTATGSVTIGETASPTIDMVTPTNSTCGNADGSAEITISGGTPDYTVMINGGMATGASPLTVTGLPAGTYPVDVTDANGCTATGSVTISDDSGPVIDSATPMDATCGGSDGSVEVAISGGTPDYTVTINGMMATGTSPLTINGLPMGTYNVDVVDANGCMTSGSVTVGESGAPTIDMVTPTDATCGNSDGSAEVVISGGTPDYTVTINGEMSTGTSPVTVTGLPMGTYTVDVVDANGCTATGSVTIGETASPTIDMVTPTNSTCGNPDGSAEITISGGTPNYTVMINGEMATGTSPLTVTGLPAGTYPVDVTDANGCTATGSVTITDAGGPVIDSTTPTDATCGGSDGSVEVAISGGTPDYTVTINGMMATGTSPLTINGLPMGTYNVDVVDANGCMTSGSVTVGETGAPTIDMVTPMDATCGNADGSAEVVISGGTPDYTVTINGEMSTSTSPVTVTDLPMGTYTVDVVDANGCTATGSVTIGETASPTIDMVTPTNSTCGNSDGSAEVVISGGTPDYTVMINGEMATGTSPVTVTDLAAGTYTVDVTDANGCTATGSVTITDAGGPVIDSATPMDATCGGSDGSVEVAISGGTPDYTVTINGMMATGTSPLTINGLPMGTYNVDVVDANGCMTSGSVTVGETGAPTIDMVTPMDATCGNADGSAEVVISGGTPDYTVMINGEMATGTSPVTVTDLAAGTYTVDVTDANGCTATGSVTITDAGGPVIDSATPMDATCGGSDGSVEVAISGGTPDYTVTINGMMATGTSPLTINGLPMGTYNVDVVDANGCMTSGSVTVGETGAPTIDMVTPMDATCGNADGSAEVVISGGTPDYTVTINGEMSTGTSPVTVTGLPMGTYTVDVVDANGCTATGSVTIGETASPTIDMITPTDATCGNADGSAEVVISGGTPDYTVMINGEMATGISPVTVTGLQTGTYTVDVTDANGCTATGSVTIGETTSPTIDMVTPTNSTCGNSDGSVEVVISGGTPDYTVTINGEMATGTSPLTVTGLPAGTYVLDVVDANGCTATGSVTITDAGGPVIDSATPTDATCGNPDGSVEVAISGGTPDYTVTINGMMATGTSPLTISGLPMGTYNVDVVDANGCMTSGSVTVGEQAAPMITSVDITNEDCGMGNGALNINVSGGTPPLIYDIGNGDPTQMDDGNFTGLSAATYNITVTDANGCTATTMATITNTLGVVIDDLNITDASCGMDNGAVTITLMGGTAPFTYDLDGEIQTNNGTYTALMEGTYPLFVTDANGCTATGSVMIGGSPAIMIDDVAATDENCGNDDGTVTITVSGGTMPITYTVDGTSQTDNGVFTGISGGTYTVDVMDANGCTATSSVTVGETASPVIDDIMTVNANCGQDDGSATINASGGTPPYTYDLGAAPQQTDPNNMFTGLASGNYPVTVTDANGCTATGTANITDANGPTIDMVTPTDATCGMATGSISVSASGGAAPLTIRLDGMANGMTVFNNLLPGTYDIEVEDANGCLSTTTATVGDTPGVVIDDITPMDATCGNADGSKTVTVSGGNGPYTVTCNGNNQTGAGPTFTFTGMTSGTYTVDVTDADGCTDTGSVTIDEADAPVINNIAAVDANCGMSNGSFTINAMGGTPPLMYDNGNGPQTSNEFTGLPSGSYDPIVIDANGCTATMNVVINDTPGVVIDNISTTAATCGNADGTKTIVVSGGTPPYTYDCNGTVQVGNNQFTGLAAGTYPIIVTDANGCTDTGTATISDADGPMITNVAITDATCGMANASISINANGGTTPYTYEVNGVSQMSNMFNGLSSGTTAVLVTDANGCAVSQNITIGDTPVVVIDNIDVTNANCGNADGSITINVTGGTAPFTYDVDGDIQMNNSTFNGLSAGTVMVTVTDANGCTATQNVTIGDDTGVMINDLTIIDENCGQMNGSITVNISGGAAPFMYQLNGGTPQTSNLFGGLGQGTNTILVTDDNGCTATIMGTVNGTESPVIDDIDTVNSNCGQADGEKTINVSGGTPPYTYECNGVTQTSPTFTGLASGNYMVIVTDDAGCTVTGTANITDIGGATIDDVQVTDADCGMPTGSITVLASGAQPIIIRLNGNDNGTNTFDGLTPNSYAIEIEDANGCISTTNAVVGDIPGVVIDDITTTPASCGQADGSKTVIISGGTAPFTFECNGVIQMDNGVFTGMAAGNYAVTVTDANGCTAISSTTIGETDGPTIDNIATINANCGMDNGSLTVNVSNGTTPYLYDIGGAQQMSNEFSGLTAGNYTVTVEDANGCTATQTATIGDTPGVVIDDILITNATCGQSDGAKEIIVSGGTAPYTFECNGATQGTGIFTGLPSGTYPVTVTDANGCTAAGIANISDADGPTIDNVSVVDAGCDNDDGSTTITISGGTAPYAVTLNSVMQTTSDMTTFNMLPAGDYGFDVVDANGCAAAGTATIGGADNPTVGNVSVMDATCGNADGSITITAADGTAPYSILLNGVTMAANPTTTFEMLPAGDYPFEITDANGCMVMGTANISDQNGPSISDISTTNASNGGMDGTITITATGGTPPYTFTVNGMNMMDNSMATFTGLPPGTYPVTVTDANGCIVTGMATVGEDTGACPTIDMVETTNAACGAMDGTITVTASGGTPPLMYDIGNGPQASNVFNGVAGGIYTVTVTDATGNCNITEMVTVSEDGAPIINNIMTGNASCMGMDGTITVDATGGVSPLMYDIGNGMQASNMFTVAAGTYTVIVTDANGCSVSEMTTIVEDGAPIINNIMTGNASCMGMDGTITVDATGGVSPLMYDIGNGAQASNMFTVAAGTYTVIVTDANGCSVSEMATVGEDGAPIINDIMTTNASCMGMDGTITVNATGGVAPLMYDIGGAMQSSNTFMVAAGNYVVTVTDANGCAIGDVVVVGEDGAPMINDITTTNASCMGTDGTITVDATGGVAPLMYDIGNGAQASNMFTVAAGTYTVIVTDANGCSISEMTTVGEDGAPMITDIAVTPSTCDDDNGTAAATVTGGTAPYEYSINGIVFQTDNDFAGLQAGDFTMTVQDANGCTATQMFTIEELLAPVVNDIIIVDASCGNADGSITIMASGGNGTLMYSIDGGMNFQPTGVFTMLPAGAYDYVITDDNCTVTGVTAISDAGAPEITSVDVTDASCGNADGTLTVNTMGGVPPLTYMVGMTTQVGDPVFTGLPAGDVSVVVTDANGCVGSTVATIVESGTLTVDILGTTTICADDMTLLTADPMNAGYDYVWTMNGMTISTTDEAVVSTGGTVTLTATLGNCTGTANTTVTVIPLPNADAGADAVLDCDNTTAILDGSGSTGSNLTYNWTTVGGNIIGANNTPMIEADAAGMYILEVTEDMAGCINADTVMVTQDGDVPVADAGADMELNCLLQAVTLDGSGSSIGLNFSYSWTGADITAANMNQQFPQVTLPGVYELTVTNTINGCTATSSVTVTEDEDMPVAETNLVIPLDCSNTEIDIDGTNSSSGPNISYQWFVDGAPILGETNPILTVDTENTYTLQVTDNSNGCVATSSTFVDDITAFPFVVTNVSGNLTCNDTIVNLDGTGSSFNPNITYEWYLMGNLVGTDLIEPITEPGFYTLVVTDTTNDCTNDDFVLVEIDTLSPVANAGFDAEIDCTNPEMILDGSMSSQGLNFTYQWAADNGQSISDTSILTPTIFETGLYQLTVTDTETGCTAFSPVVIFENMETPTGAEIVLDLPTCQGDNDGIITIANVEGGQGPFTYSINGGTFFSQNDFGNLSTDSFAIMVQSPNGCIYTDSVFLPDGNDLMVDLSDDIRILLGEEATFEAVTNVIPFQIDTLIWTAKDTLCPNCFEQVVSPMMTTSYSVFIQDNNGCTAEDDLTIFVNENINVYVPNVFSPNGDGENDMLYIQSEPGIVQEINDFKIFNRWGNLIFENSNFQPNDADQGWNGVFNGKAMNPQVFVYKIEVEFVTGEVKTFMGDFTLMK